MSTHKNIRKALIEGLLAESMDVMIDGFDYSNSLNTLSDILSLINNKVYQHVVELIGRDKYDEYGSSYFAYDGGESPYEPTGTINFYTQRMPQELVSHICKFIGNLLMVENDLIVGFRMEKSGSQDSNVIRIHVQQNDSQTDAPPDMNMSNANAYYFFTEILRYSKNEFDRGGFPVDDVMTRIDFAEQNMGLADYSDGPEMSQQKNMTHYKFGYDAEMVQKRLSLMREICEFAKKNGYKKINCY